MTYVSTAISGNDLHSNISVTLTIICHQTFYDGKWPFHKFVTCFRYTDNPLTIYGYSGKLCHMLSVILTIQQPYMAIQENYIICLPWHWWSNDHIWSILDTIENFCRAITCKAWNSFSVIYACIMMIQWNFCKCGDSLGLSQLAAADYPAHADNFCDINIIHS